jgi:hypothetical protein
VGHQSLGHAGQPRLLLGPDPQAGHRAAGPAAGEVEDGGLHRVHGGADGLQPPEAVDLQPTALEQGHHGRVDDPWQPPGELRDVVDVAGGEQCRAGSVHRCPSFVRRGGGAAAA